MVNLVVRHHSASPLVQNTIINRNKQQASPPVVMTTSVMGSGSRDRMVPSPVIRVPSYPNKRPVSPLTATESIFGGGAPVEQSRSQSPGENQHRGGGMTARLEPSVISRDSSMDEHGDLICDYDQNVTALYELLESSQWDQARLRCRTHPEEVQTWIVRRDATSTRWKLLPLHAAVIFQSPAPVLESMLLEYPVAAGKRDDQGMLPLHLAFRHKQDESMLELLLSHYPQAVVVKDRRERLPIDHAGDTQFSASLLQNYAEACTRCQQTPATSNPHRDGQVDVLKRNYEDQIAELLREHGQELRILQQKMEQDKERIRTQHDQEMDELRDLLSREVATGARGRQCEEEVQELQHALSQANAENQILRGAMEEQKLHYTNLLSQMHKILEDQNTLQVYCEQQQQELEVAQQLREQLVRSLAQKDGTLKNNSREICQFSKDLRLRTEQILSGGTQAPALKEMVIARPEISKEIDAEWDAQDEGEHVDDISAITDDNF